MPLQPPATEHDHDARDEDLRSSFLRQRISDLERWPDEGSSDDRDPLTRSAEHADGDVEIKLYDHDTTIDLHEDDLSHGIDIDELVSRCEPDA